MLKIIYSLPEIESLKSYVSEIYGLPFCDFDICRDMRGTVYSACTSQKKYVFKLSSAYYVEKSVCAVKLINFLQKRNFSAVEIIPTSAGELYISVPMPEGIRIGVLYEFIEGRAATFDDIEEIGKFAARLHNEMSAYNGIMPQLFDKRLLIDELPKMLRMMKYDESKIIEIERVSNAVWDKIKGFPPGIVHGDFDMGNIIIDDGTIKLFDFDDAGRMPLIYDVAYICNRIDDKLFTKESAELTENTIELFLKGYHSVNPHSEFNAKDVLNWIAVRRIDMQMIGIRFWTVKIGRRNSFRFWDMLHKWLTDWEKMFL